MALRIHPVSAAKWQRLAATRPAYVAGRSDIDLVELEADAADPLRRTQAEHALIQSYVDALAPQRASR